MSVDCQISFDNPDGVYYSGEDLSGAVIMTIMGEYKVRRIELKIEGYAECQWREERHSEEGTGEQRHSETTYFSGHEQYLNSINELVSSEQTIPEGTHSYNFQINIPEGAPSSLSEEYGQIRYRVRVKFDRPWKVDDVFEENFTVFCPINLFLNPSLALPYEEEIIKHYCCFCCVSKPVICNFRIPKSGFMPDEEVYLEANVNNPTNTGIRYIDINIFKRISYESSSPYQSSKQEEVCVFTGSSDKNATPLKNGVRDFSYKFKIPNVSPSTLNPQFRVIQISYILKIKAWSSGCHKSPYACIPITIGNVVTDKSPVSIPPISASGFSSTFRFDVPEEEMKNISVASIHPVPSAPSIQDEDLPLPSFSETTKEPKVEANAETATNYSHQIGFVIPDNSN